jgi:hypothetical protein
MQPVSPFCLPTRLLQAQLQPHTPYLCLLTPLSPPPPHPPHPPCLQHTDSNGWTALHISASKGYEVIVRELLARGAAPNLLDKVRTLSAGHAPPPRHCMHTCRSTLLQAYLDPWLEPNTPRHTPSAPSAVVCCTSAPCRRAVPRCTCVPPRATQQSSGTCCARGQTQHNATMWVGTAGGDGTTHLLKRHQQQQQQQQQVGSHTCTLPEQAAQTRCLLGVCWLLNLRFLLPDCPQAGKRPLDIAMEQQLPAAAGLLAEALAGRGLATPTGTRHSTAEPCTSITPHHTTPHHTTPWHSMPAESLIGMNCTDCGVLCPTSVLKSVLCCQFVGEVAAVNKSQHQPTSFVVGALQKGCTNRLCGSCQLRQSRCHCRGLARGAT